MNEQKDELRNFCYFSSSTLGRTIIGQTPDHLLVTLDKPLACIEFAQFALTFFEHVGQSAKQDLCADILIGEK